MSGRTLGLSIRARLILATALLLGAVAGAPLVLLPDRLERQAREELELRALDVARAAAASSAVAVDFGDRQRGAEVLRGLATVSGVVYADLRRGDGDTLAAWGLPGPPLEASGPEATVSAYSDDRLHVRVPVLAPGGGQGTLQVGFGLEVLQRRRAQARDTVAAESAGIFLVGFVALVLLSTLLTRPVRELSAVASRISQGDEQAARQLRSDRGDEAGTVAAAFGSVLDRLELQRAMLQSQSEASSEGILTLDLEGRATTHNRRLRELWGLEAGDLAGATWGALLPRLAAKVAGPFPAWLTAPAPVPPGDLDQSFRLELRDGRHLTVHAATVRKPAGERIGTGLYFRDVSRQVDDQRRIEELAEGLERRVEARTLELGAANQALNQRLDELRRAQEQLVIADRRISVGRLAAGVAHEINNPLAYVLGNLDFAARELPAVEGALAPGAPEAARPEALGRLAELRSAVADAAQGAGRVAHIVKGLKSFARSDDDTREPVGLERPMRAALEMAGQGLRHRARLVEDFSPAPLVLANEVRLTQVFLNLLINAAQAIPPGAAARHEVTVRIGTGPDGWAVGEVRDTGCGIPADVLGHIFDPFFTTKSQGQGTGLGLSISQGIVAACGGTIEVETAEGRGSAFRVRLPPAPMVEAEAAAPAMPQAGRPARVLVIDDEPQVATVLRRLLTPEHEVTIAAGAAEALGVIGGGQRFDVILCDLMMPGMDGMAFHAELGRRDADLARRVVFVTAGAFTPDAAAFLEHHGDRHLKKPIDPSELRRLIHEQLPA